MYGVDDVCVAWSTQRDVKNRPDDERYRVELVEICWSSFCDSRRASFLIIQLYLKRKRRGPAEAAPRQML